MDGETRGRLRGLVSDAVDAGEDIAWVSVGREDVRHQRRMQLLARLDAILAPPADGRATEVAMQARVYTSGRVHVVALDGREFAVAHGAEAVHFGTHHVVALRARLPLPPEPVTVEAEVDRE